MMTSLYRLNESAPLYNNKPTPRVIVRSYFINKDITMKITKLATIGALAISLAGLSACNNMSPAKTMPVKASTMTPAMTTMNVVQVAQSNPDFSILVEAVQAAGLAGALSDTGSSYTVLAPTNAAFARALADTGMTKAQLLNNKPLLTKILTYHVIKGNTPVYQKDVRPGNYTMLSNDTLVITPQGMLMDTNGRMAKILKTDIAASNGVVHVIDNVLLPK